MIKQIFMEDHFESLKTKRNNLRDVQNTLALNEILFTLEVLYSEFINKINKFYNTIILGKNGIIDTH